MLYALIKRFITHPIIRMAAIWIGLPVAALKVFGQFDAVATFLDGISLEAGNIRISLYFLTKAIIAGAVLFWLGRVSTNAGQRVIRSQEALDVPTRELFAKLFEIALYVGIFVLLLQVLGLDPTALTVFGGALGVSGAGCHARRSLAPSASVLLDSSSSPGTRGLAPRTPPGSRPAGEYMNVRGAPHPAPSPRRPGEGSAWGGSGTHGYAHRHANVLRGPLSPRAGRGLG